MWSQFLYEKYIYISSNIARLLRNNANVLRNYTNVSRYKANIRFITRIDSSNNASF